MQNLTKYALEDSLKKFLLKKPLDKITISDLTSDCGISRMAFYYHFKDIYDLVEWACIEDATRALQGKKTYATWQEGLLQEEREFIAHFYKYSFVGVMLDWIRRGMKKEPRELAEKICVTMHGNIINSLKNAENMAKGNLKIF